MQRGVVAPDGVGGEQITGGELPVDQVDVRLSLPDRIIEQDLTLPQMLLRLGAPTWQRRRRGQPGSTALRLAVWSATLGAMEVHLVDGTYELFRQFFGQPPRPGADGAEVGAVRGVLRSLVGLLAGGATHVGVATDHVIESFRNDLWAGYKTGVGIDPRLAAQFPLLEEALTALGLVVWPMVELEADDALASAAEAAARDPAVDRVLLCTPDKDLAQCVVGTRVVQLDRRRDVVVDEDAVRSRFGVGPASIPDWLALVGDSADGFPGLPGWGRRSAAVVLGHYRHLEAVPDAVGEWDLAVRRSVRQAATLAATLAEARPAALLFRRLATLRVDPHLLGSVTELTWRGPTGAWEALCRRLRDPVLAERALALAERRQTAGA